MKTLVLLLLAVPLAAQEILPPEPPSTLPRYTVKQGHLVVIQLDAQACAQRVSTYAGVWRCRPDYTVIIAVSPGALVQTEELRSEDQATTFAHIEVVKSNWPSVHLPKPKPGPTPPPGRLEKDSQDRLEAYDTHRKQERWANYHLRLPLWSPTIAYRVSAPFWLQRFYGEAAKADPHKGVDLAAEQPGAWDINPPPVWSIAPGVVVLAQELWTDGKTVIVYHGDGIYAAYCHLSHIAVKTGDMVSGGARLGTVGNTGRSRGNHLHLTMRINGTLVDPLAAMETLNNSAYLN